MIIKCPLCHVMVPAKKVSDFYVVEDHDAEVVAREGTVHLLKLHCPFSRMIARKLV
jgi:hypothetical protein